GGPFDDRFGLVGRESGLLLEQERHFTGDHGGGHRGTRQSKVARAVTGGDHVVGQQAVQSAARYALGDDAPAGRHHIGLGGGAGWRAPGREPPDDVIRDRVGPTVVGGSDRQ